MEDGGTRTTHPVNSVFNDTVLVTHQFWRYTTTTRTLQMPSGLMATFEQGNSAGGALLVEVHDVYGNSITSHWVPELLAQGCGPCPNTRGAACPK